MTTLLPFFGKIYRKFLKKSEHVDFETWYQEQQQKCMQDREPSEETTLKNISSQDISHFDAQLKLVFQRNYSKAQHALKSSFLSKSIMMFRSNKIFRFMLSGCIALILLSSLYLWLSVSHIEIGLSMVKNKIRHEVILPAAIDNFLSRKGPAIGATQKEILPAPTSSQSVSQPVVDSTNHFNVQKQGSQLPDSTAKARIKHFHKPKPSRSLPTKSIPAIPKDSLTEKTNQLPLPENKQPEFSPETGNVSSPKVPE